MAVFETAFRSSFLIFSVRAINRGTLPIGSITTKRAIVDLTRLSMNRCNGGSRNEDDDNDNNNIFCPRVEKI
jgi:hypothetical protein